MILLLVRLLRTALLVRPVVLELALGLRATALVFALLVGTPWRRLLLVRLLRTVLHAPLANSLTILAATSSQTALPVTLGATELKLEPLCNAPVLVLRVGIP